MKNPIKYQNAFTLLELLVVFLLIGIFTAMAVPYYQNAVQSARNSEGVLWWGHLKRLTGGQNITQQRATRWENEINNKRKLKYFTVSLHCRIKENDEPCWEAELHLKNQDQHIQYYLATTGNMSSLLCVPINHAGDSFCQSLSGLDDGPDTATEGKPAYTLHY